LEGPPGAIEAEAGFSEWGGRRSRQAASDAALRDRCAGIDCDPDGYFARPCDDCAKSPCASPIVSPNAFLSEEQDLDDRGKPQEPAEKEPAEKEPAEKEPAEKEPAEKERAGLT
jgi:hypothetical protein